MLQVSYVELTTAGTSGLMLKRLLTAVYQVSKYVDDTESFGLTFDFHNTIQMLTPIFSACLGLSTDYDCCTVSNPCNKGKGDCDSDGECAGGLICGKDNCRDFTSNAESNTDCCVEPGYLEASKL